MTIICGEKHIETYCTGCLCHEMATQFGTLVHGSCCECGCPKTKEAFDARYTEKVQP